MSDNPDNNTTNRKPDQEAYTITQGRDGKDYWNSVGKAWSHHDGKGTTIKLHSTPVSGEVILRDMREKTMQQYDYQQGQAPQQNVNQYYGPEQ